MLKEPTRTTKEYSTAKALCDHAVELMLYDDRPYTLGQVVRVKIMAKGTEYGHEISIQPYENISVGEALDIAISKLMPAMSNGLAEEKAEP